MSERAFVKRTYQRSFGLDFEYVNIQLCESKLMIGAAHVDRVHAMAHLRAARAQVEQAIVKNPAFATALVPLPIPRGLAPGLVRGMYEAAQSTGVGPMAAVAGAIAQSVGRALGGEIVVENGGDLYIRLERDFHVAVFAGESPLSMRIGVRIGAGEWGVCTSAGKVGPSLSFGQADAAMVVAHDAALADAAATALGNYVRDAGAMQRAVQRICACPGIEGALAVLNDKLAAAGNIELIPMDEDTDG